MIFSSPHWHLLPSLMFMPSKGANPLLRARGNRLFRLYRTKLLRNERCFCAKLAPPLGQPDRNKKRNLQSARGW
jgi:hypothetical protein